LPRPTGLITVGPGQVFTLLFDVTTLSAGTGSDSSGSCP